ncbi:MAG: hypothetical protein Q8R15_03500 [Candidatus Micrarchaeota archaeon]|nr:hypothetical protein [Candidatus Micrarchaeota archaeon]
MKFLALFLTALVVLTATATGLTLYSTSGHVDMNSNVNGQLTFWFQAENAGVFAVNTAGPVLTTVTPANGNVAAGAVKSFSVSFAVSRCSEGVFYQTVNLDYTSNGVTQRTSKLIELDVQRGSDCTPVVAGYPQNVVVGNGNSISPSSLSLANQFDPSEVNLAIISQPGNTNIANGETSTLYLTVVNRGSPGLVNLQLVADPSLNAVLSDYSFVLERSEAKQVALSVNPQNMAGKQWATIQVIRSGQVAAVKEVYFDIANTHQLQLTMPQIINIENCGGTVIAGTATNLGSGVEQATVLIPSLYAVSNQVVIRPRDSVPFVLNIDASHLSAGSRMLEINLASNAAVNKQIVQLNVKQCSDSAVTLLNYSTVVMNTGNSTMVGLVASVVGIPQDWQVLPQPPVNVVPGESKTLTAVVKTKGTWDSDVVPTVVVKDVNGNEVQRSTQAPVKPNSATGLFLAGAMGLSGLQWIAAILFVALIIAVGTAKASIRRAGV